MRVSNRGALRHVLHGVALYIIFYGPLSGVFRWHWHLARGGDHGGHGPAVRGGVPRSLLSGFLLDAIRLGSFRSAGSILRRLVRGLGRVGAGDRDRGPSGRGDQQQPAVMVHQSPITTSPQIPMPVVGMGPPADSAQVYNHTAVTTGTAQQPGFSRGAAAGAYSYTPPGGAQQPYQYAAAPSNPMGSNPPPYARGGGQGASGGGYAGGAYPSSTYGYQSPPQFMTGVNGGNAR